MKYPALVVSGVDGDFAIAAADDYSPTAAESSADAVTIFFRDNHSRDAARGAIALAYPSARVDARDVDDEDWARRSQENLEPIAVGGLTIYPDLPALRDLHRSSPPPAATPLAIVIRPSMGFGTGHHATTRLCLTALQIQNLSGASVLDVGTGSGVLAIAAARLGAASAIGIDNDPDAVHAARENLALNPGVRGVRFEIADLTGDGPTALAAADVVAANLTGTLLAREAGVLLLLVRPGGRLIISGLLASERPQVLEAFAQAEVDWEKREDGWLGLVLRPRMLDSRANDRARSAV